MKAANEFNVGDIVDVIDRRDGAIVESGTRILEVSYQDGKPYAHVVAGFAVSLVCLRHHQTSIADALPRSLNHAKRIANEN